MAKHTIELDITDAVHGGNGLGRHKGRPIFVPYTIPGERITARIVEDKRSYAHAEGVELIKASPDRVQPECPHFGPGRCGGCHLQHMNYAAQLRYKRDVVLDQLKRLGGIKKPDKVVRDFIASPDPWGYRSRASFHITPEGKLGFVSTDPPRLEPVEWCYILDPRAMALLEAMSAGLACAVTFLQWNHVMFGRFDEEEAYARVSRPGRVFEPDPSLRDRYDEGFGVYRQLYPALAGVRLALLVTPSSVSAIV